MAKKILMLKEEAKGLSASESIKFVKDMLKTKSKKLTLKFKSKQGWYLKTITDWWGNEK